MYQYDFQEVITGYHYELDSYGFHELQSLVPQFQRAMDHYNFVRYPRLCLAVTDSPKSAQTIRYNKGRRAIIKDYEQRAQKIAARFRGIKRQEDLINKERVSALCRQAIMACEIKRAEERIENADKTGYKPSEYERLMVKLMGQKRHERER
jgi:hypothetical protein